MRTSRRRFLQTAAVATAAAQLAPRLSAASATAAPAAHSYPENGTLIPDERWHLWIDEKAAWKEDDIFLPEDVAWGTGEHDGKLCGKGKPLPVNAPTGGWSALTPATGKQVTLPTSVLVDTGTSGGAELFASALVGNQRADLIGEHTIGRAASQKLVRLPDGAGLWLSTTRYLTPKGDPLHEKGLEPTVPVDDPDVEFGVPAPTKDPILEKAIERLSDKKAA